MIEIKNLTKTFSTASGDVEALKNINITIEDGDIYGIIGMSGAGKSTLVRTINMLERPTDGEVIIDGVNIGELPKKELRKVRSKVTMIFQGFNLLMQRNCLDNICFPLELAGIKKAEAREKAMELLEIVGLPDKALAYPAQLSGGQQQRIAIARALATEPKILLCDEATSALDPKTTASILDLISDINKKMGITVVVITHQMSVVEKICNKVAILDDGVVVENGNVAEIFSHPQSQTARQLVMPDDSEHYDYGAVKGEKLLRLVFNGLTTSDKPLISAMAVSEKIMANIRYASAKTIRGKVYGNMIISLDDEKENVKKAKAFLIKEGVQVEEVEDNGK